MAWKIIERKLGRAGSVKQRLARQRDWDRTYGEGNWEIGYVLDGIFVDQVTAFEKIYYQSYVEHFRNHPEDLTELLQTAKKLRNPHAEATTGVDLQIPAITQFLQRHDLKLSGNELVDIGSWQGQASHTISIRLSPLHIKAAHYPTMTLEQFWQEKKCLAIWQE
jgi:hypothetical protein